MDRNKREQQLQWQEMIDELKASALPDLDKVLRAYDIIVDEHIAHSQREIELARALKDKETVVREQIKMETMKFSRKRLEELHMIFTRSES